ncbi:MAG TPA: metal ABC transporter substrate-binding protein [Solirubrobacteraceae bacterium]|nr:metal ABC transporter substrate-binding protein [Solirubrobacteraceae bacterium]
MRIVLKIFTTALALAAILAGCGGGDAQDDGRLRVVVTTPQLADFARQVGGDRVEVEALLDARADPHEYEPRPSDAEAVARADVVLRSGGELDAWLEDVVDSAGGDADVVVLADEIRAEGDDPHWWQDPRNVLRAIGVLRRELGGGGSGARAYAERVLALDESVAACMRSIPRERRKLVTTHDAFGWFARRYGIEVLGSILPAGSTSAQPSARDVRELVDAIRREGVRTVFPESALDRRLEAAVARDAGATVGEPLYADTLAPDGTYLSTLRHDAAAMAEAFGGDCEL